MGKEETQDLETIFPRSLQLAKAFGESRRPEDFVLYLQQRADCYPRYPYLAELAELELAIHQLTAEEQTTIGPAGQLMINPSLRIYESAWSALPGYLLDQAITPQQNRCLILLYCTPDRQTRVVEASDHDLLALKIVSEGLETRAVAAEAKIAVGLLDQVVKHGVTKGFLLAPGSGLNRDTSYFTPPCSTAENQRAETFTLQWHITQSCDLHCRHCYDRSTRAVLDLPRAIAILDDLYDFARQQRVQAQVSFSGGNPLLYPHFFQLYQEATDRGFILAILGNPTSDEILGRLTDISRPAFYQVSLEGLASHNDYIRGAGHFERVMNFLPLLRTHNIFSMVMLTLTRANCEQLLELAEFLRGKVDLFTFNRLAMVGEGAALASPALDRLPTLLREYMSAAANNPALSLKDNYFNILLAQKGQPLTGGCTGFGCGAAFNFVSLLPDGEVHACRKFPSPIGNIFTSSLQQIYSSPAAHRYRQGPAACNPCELRPFCRGCPAVAHGFGIDPFLEHDPYCFKASTPGAGGE